MAALRAAQNALAGRSVPTPGVGNGFTYFTHFQSCASQARLTSEMVND